MAVAALVLLSLFIFIGVIVRSVLQRRRTGAFGVNGVHGKPGSAEWFAGLAFVLTVVGVVAGPALALAGVLAPVPVLDSAPVKALGIVAALAGLTTMVVAQTAMSTSWRIGVDPAERTALVVDGLFGLVRNPIFTSMLIFATGLAAMVPNPVTLAGAVLGYVGIELQVRVVEEPYLRRVHGSAYLEYAARTGRFLPGIGRLATIPVEVDAEAGRP